MNIVRFDLTIPPSVVAAERKRRDIGSLDERGLRSFACGEIRMRTGTPPRTIAIESEVYDYLDQLLGVLKHIDSGECKTFTVSGDYFSNNLGYVYCPDSKEIEIYDVNEGESAVVVPYMAFRESLLEFAPRALSILMTLYPELGQNEEFLRLIAAG